eukprot:TRINITY_DN1739_c0_g1_i1.p1 TRINITY_DN1739_c0_g1~~TRINITY_DN1739_c0_g1_i1.p1  ORF type:complete len:357 (+),score=32.22 TRINITY_DN1739_c0_g1_i1:126-1073(+)
MVVKWKDYVYANENPTPTWKLVHYLDQTFTGISQMLFIENPVIGVGIASALIVANPPGGLAVIAGSALATLWSNLLKLDTGLTRSGLYCFNSILVVAALNAFVTPLPAVVAMSIVGSLASVWLFDKGVKLLPFPVVSIPFIMVAQLSLLASRSFPSLSAIQFAPPPPVDITMFPEFLPWLSYIASTVPLTFSQLFFTANTWVGVAIIAAGFLGDRRVMSSAVLGAAIGTSVGYFLGYDVANGLWGFNSALTAMALYPTFGLPLWGALTAAGLSAALQPIALTIFGNAGLPALSFSFCLCTITFLRLYQKIRNQHK